MVPAGMHVAVKFHGITSIILGLAQSVGFLVLLFRLRAVLGVGESVSSRQKLRAITLVAILGATCW
jgi:hypothetical protein